MVLKVSQRISDGASADVFLSDDGERVYKLYRRITEVSYVDEPPRLFQNEVIGYGVAMRTDSLRSHVPGFCGTPRITEVLSDSGVSAMADYHGECCLELDFIPGECRKIGAIPSECDHIVVALMDAMSRVMRCSFDASFFNWCDEQRIVTIDFAPNV